MKLKIDGKGDRHSSSWREHAYPRLTINHDPWLTERLPDEMKELHNGLIPDVPTLPFVSNDQTMARMTGTTESWQLIHENYLSHVTNGQLVKLDCALCSCGRA